MENNKMLFAIALNNCTNIPAQGLESVNETAKIPTKATPKIRTCKCQVRFSSSLIGGMSWSLLRFMTQTFWNLGH